MWRIAVHTSAVVTILHVVDRDQAGGGELRSGRSEESLADFASRKVIENPAPIDAAIAEARSGYDLIVVGASVTWGTLPTLFGQRDAPRTRVSGASVLIVRPGGSNRRTTDPAVSSRASGAAAAGAQSPAEPPA